MRTARPPGPAPPRRLAASWFHGPASRAALRTGTPVAGDGSGPGRPGGTWDSPRRGRRPAHTRLMTGPTCSVIVPAHNEEAVLGRLLSRLLESARPGEFDIVVVANGCTDGTAEVAATFGPQVRVVRSEIPSKREALRLGDREARWFPRLYVDADVELGTEDARRLYRAVATQGVLAAAPQRDLDLPGHGRRPGRVAGFRASRAGRCAGCQGPHPPPAHAGRPVAPPGAGRDRYQPTRATGRRPRCQRPHPPTGSHPAGPPGTAAGCLDAGVPGGRAAGPGRLPPGRAPRRLCHLATGREQPPRLANRLGQPPGPTALPGGRGGHDEAAP